MVRKRRPARTIAALALGLSAVAASAWAEPRRDIGPAMPLGSAAPAPEGFIDLCRRAPDQCPALGPVPDLARLAAEANRRRWQALFGLAPAPAAAPAAAPAPTATRLSSAPIIRLIPRLAPVTSEPVEMRPSPPPASALAAEDLARPALEASGEPLAVEAVAAVDFTDVAVAGEDRPLAPTISETPAAFALDRAGWRLINGVNRRFNRTIRHVKDRERHGLEDRWTLPVGGQGDCEDYVLAKRAALIDAGVPAEALSIAIVETAWGEVHAVLLLASDRGEYVLDNLSPWVSRWDRVNYRWRERQARGSAFDWVNVAL